MIPTRAALLLKQSEAAQEEFKQIVFESHRSKRKQRSKVDFEAQNDSKAPSKKTKFMPEQFDFTKARREVINLGISGTADKAEKEEKEIELAIKLGAKPPKKPYKNYKQILEEKQRKKEKEESTTEQIAKKFRFGATASYQKYAVRKTPKQPKNVLKDYGTVKKKQKNKK